jgi:hypothetical protein
LLEDEVKKYLGGVLYHNLERVSFLYDATFGFVMKVGEPNWTMLLEAIERRHDCVHRNGLDAEGKRLLVFTRDYVGQVIAGIEALVRRIESRFPSDDEGLPF